ncbi:hypothetical protein ACFX14_031945 [Malus domestica]
MKNHIIEGLRRRMGFNKGFDVPPNGAARGLSLWWNDLVEVMVVLQPSDQPWFYGGDLNEYLRDFEKLGGLEWSRDKFKARRLEIANLTTKLKDLQMDWEANMEQIKDTSAHVHMLKAQEELYWQQRSRIRWLQAGDSNTSFFHQCTIQIRRQNMIAKIKYANSQWMKDEQGIRCTVDDHFMNLFTTNSQLDLGSLLDYVKPVVTTEMNKNLTMPNDDEEMQNVVFQMGGLKALGLDGVEGVFFSIFLGDHFVGSSGSSSWAYS